MGCKFETSGESAVSREELDRLEREIERLEYKEQRKQYEETVTFDSGARRSGDVDDTRYDLICPEALRRLAERCALGAKKYSEHNFLKGIPSSCMVNHMMAHLEKWRAGDRSDDHLAGVMWGAMALMHFERFLPDMIQVYPERVDGSR